MNIEPTMPARKVPAEWFTGDVNKAAAAAIEAN
jgi:hypothetical protein